MVTCIFLESSKCKSNSHLLDSRVRWRSSNDSCTASRRIQLENGKISIGLPTIGILGIVIYFKLKAK